MSPRILVLPGTLEAASPNHALAFEAARILSLSSASLGLLSLADYPLPILDTDAALSIPPSDAMRLAEQIAGQDALLVVSPDANGSVPPLLKNAVDWVARITRSKTRAISPFRDLLVALASASAGGPNGGRVLDAWRFVFLSLGAEVVGPQMMVDGGSQAFDERGRLRDAGQAARLEAFLADVVMRAQALGRHHL